MPQNSLEHLSRAARLIADAVAIGPSPALRPYPGRAARGPPAGRGEPLPRACRSGPGASPKACAATGASRRTAGTEDPRRALDFIAAHPAPAIFHLKDFHEPLRESADVRRRLRDVYEAVLDRGKFVVITSPVRFIPEELERSMLFLELRPPDLVELEAFVRDESPRDRSASDADLQQVARALQGLTLDEARYALRRALAAGQPLGPEALPALLEEKRLLVNRSGVIEFISPSTRPGAKSAAWKA